jgi:hypothetical protein
VGTEADLDRVIVRIRKNVDELLRAIDLDQNALRKGRDAWKVSEALRSLRESISGPYRLFNKIDGLFVSLSQLIGALSAATHKPVWSEFHCRIKRRGVWVIKTKHRSGSKILGFALDPDLNGVGKITDPFRFIRVLEGGKFNG